MSRTHTLIAFLLGVAPVAAAEKTPELWFVISSLKKEASDAWRAGQGWPRNEPNFAMEKSWLLPREDVARGLTRRLHPEPAIDAYIKWQLLSFADDLNQLDGALLHRIADTAPKPLPQPVVRQEWLAISGPSRAYIAIARQVTYVRNLRPVVGAGTVALVPELGVVSTGTVLDAEGSTRSYITVLQQANEKLQAERSAVSRANDAILRYRQALLSRVPQAGGLRLAMRIKDLGDRIAAGDPSTEQAADELLEASDSLPADLPPRTRRILAGWVRELGQMRTTVHDSVAPGKRENQALLYQHIVAVPEQHIRTLLERLEPGGPKNDG